MDPFDAIALEQTSRSVDATRKGVRGGGARSGDTKGPPPAEESTLDIALFFEDKPIYTSTSTGSKKTPAPKKTVRTFWHSHCPVCDKPSNGHDACACKRKTLQELLKSPRSVKPVCAGSLPPVLAHLGTALQEAMVRHSHTCAPELSAAFMAVWQEAVGHASDPCAGLGSPAWHALAAVVSSTGKPQVAMYRQDRRPRPPNLEPGDTFCKPTLNAHEPPDGAGGGVGAKEDLDDTAATLSDIDWTEEAVADRVQEVIGGTSSIKPHYRQPVIDVVSSLSIGCGPFITRGPAGEWLAAAAGSGLLVRMLHAAKVQGFTPGFAPCETFQGQRALYGTVRVIPAMKMERHAEFDSVSDFDNDPWGDSVQGLTEGPEPGLWGHSTWRSGGALTWGRCHRLARRRVVSRKRDLDVLVVPAFGYVAGFYSAAVEGPFAPCGLSPHLMGFGVGVAPPPVEPALDTDVAVGAAADPVPGGGEDTHTDAEAEAHATPSTWVGPHVAAAYTHNLAWGAATVHGVPSRVLTLAATIRSVTASSPLLTPCEGVTFAWLVTLPGASITTAMEAVNTTPTAWMQTQLKAFLPTIISLVPGMSVQVLQHARRWCVAVMYHESPLETQTVVKQWWNECLNEPVVSFQDDQRAEESMAPEKARRRFTRTDEEDEETYDADEDGEGAGVAAGAGAGAGASEFDASDADGHSRAPKSISELRQRYHSQRNTRRATTEPLDMHVGVHGVGKATEASPCPRAATGEWRTLENFNLRTNGYLQDAVDIAARTAQFLDKELQNTFPGAGAQDHDTPDPLHFQWNGVKRVYTSTQPADVAMGGYRVGVGCYLDPAPGTTMAQYYGAAWGWRFVKAPPKSATLDETPDTMTWNKWHQRVANAMPVRGTRLPESSEARSLFLSAAAAIEPMVVEGFSSTRPGAVYSAFSLKNCLAQDNLYATHPDAKLPFWDKDAAQPISPLNVAV